MPSIVLHKVISGDQPGAEQAARRAAAACGVRTDGDTSGTRQNVRDADATLWLGATTSADAQETVAACLGLGKPWLPLTPEVAFEPFHVAAWITQNTIRVLHVTGSRESEEPGIGARAEPFLIHVLEQLGHERIS
jgi:hypothetical protein